jgi:hypothetical protein
MAESLKSAIVRIWTSHLEDGSVIGAGFLVGKRHILTCAHVVTQALGLPDNTREAPKEEIWLDFPLLPHRERISAKVAQWLPLFPDGKGDIAGLELSIDPPIQANVAHLVSATTVWGHSFRAFGFPPGQDNGVWVTGQLLDQQAMDWIVIEGTKAQGYSIGQGFSGTPVWDTQVQGIVGIVVAASQPTDLRTAFIIPTAVLQGAWPLITVLQAEPRNPYKGLQPFRKDDAGDFFGREQMTEDLLKIVKKLTTSARSMIDKRLLAIIGPSGSGKSSLVMAGLLPQLQQGALPGSNSWIYLEPMLPSKYPFEALVLTLAKYFPEKSLRSLREDLKDETARGLHLLVRFLAKGLDTKVVLFIDQFEELFTQTQSEDERQSFINILLTACCEPQGPLIVFLTMRADFYDRPMQYPKLAQTILQQQHLVLPMNIVELRAVIEQPAALPDVQLTFESGLVDELLFEMRDQIGALPLLQFTLTQLFQRRLGHMLTLQAYQNVGGVKGALTQHAETVYLGLPSDEHRRLARALFVRLIDPGITEQDTTRRRARLVEFSLPDSKQNSQLQETMNAFITERLLVTNEVAGIITVEISHEALIQAWTRLAQWKREVHENLPLQQTLSKDVAAWERLHRAKDRLYRGQQLKEALTWARCSMPSQQELHFLQASARHQRQRRVKTVGMLLLSVLVTALILQILLYIRPSWCPTSLCPLPQPLLQQGSDHDSNLELTFHALESPSYLIPNDPSQFTLANLPSETGTQLVDKSLSSPYRIAVGVHSLQRGTFGIVIEEISIVIKQIHSVPYPLRTWIDQGITDFSRNLYQGTYRGESVGKTLSTVSVPQPLIRLQLVPGESDEFTVQILSQVVAEIRFQVQVTYRVLNESIQHTLFLSKTFQVIFSDSLNWRPYHLQNGRLVANP